MRVRDRVRGDLTRAARQVAAHTAVMFARERSTHGQMKLPAIAQRGEEVGSRSYSPGRTTDAACCRTFNKKCP